MKNRIQSCDHPTVLRCILQNLIVLCNTKADFSSVQCVMTNISKQLRCIAIKVLVQQQSHEAIRSGTRKSFILADANISAC